MELPAHTFEKLRELIHAESGIVLGPEKAYLVRHRLEPLVRSEGLGGFDDLLRQLHPRRGSAASLRNALIDAITVKETQFFRDHAFFDVLLEHVLPACAAGVRKGRHRLRIWSAAASTGQEAYSVAMLVREFIASGAANGANGANGLEESRISILASDISAAAIESAKAGQYAKSEVHRGVSESRLKRHFHHSGASWRVDESLARMIEFRTFNLLDKMAHLAPPGAFDLILCRNVLIYFDDSLRRRVCRALYDALQDGGWLALGSAESLYGMEDRFETVIYGKTILYRKPQRGG